MSVPALKSLIIFSSPASTAVITGASAGIGADIARELAARLSPDAAVVDLLLQNDDGLKLVRELRGDLPTLRIVVLSMLDAAIYRPKALQAGANFFVSKLEGPAAIVQALRQPIGPARAAREARCSWSGT